MTFTITEHQSLLIEDLIDTFNFEKVSIVMTALDWKWVNQDGKGHSVPTIDRMKRSCRNLLYRSLIDKSVGTGGFEARYYAPGDEEVEVETFGLSFVIDRTFTDGDW
jgi:hypothetical protein